MEDMYLYDIMCEFSTKINKVFRISKNIYYLCMVCYEGMTTIASLSKELNINRFKFYKLKLAQS